MANPSNGKVVAHGRVVLNDRVVGLYVPVNQYVQCQRLPVTLSDRRSTAMAYWKIDLNFYGPYRKLTTLQTAVRESGERQVLYMARHEDVTGFATNLGLGALADDALLNEEKCKVVYIGITRAGDLGSRFDDHHKIGEEALTGRGLPPITDFWAGYLYRPAELDTEGRVIATRLLIAEDVMISWFLPPLNRAGVRRSGPEEYGSGSIASAHIYFHWWTTQGQRRATLPGFPKELHYNRSGGYVEAI